jgi:hypothetical protein
MEIRPHVYAIYRGIFIINFYWLGDIMKLKSETKQVITFLKRRHDCMLQGVSLFDATNELNLNYDMVQRALILLHKANIISRDSRGRNSKYIYPVKIGLGDIINAVEGISIMGDTYLEGDITEALNSEKI